MKKLVAIALVLIFLLAGCSKDEPLMTESKTFYFTQFGVLDGKDAAVVAIVEYVNGEYVDISREETLSFADNVLIESFDLRRTSAPTESSIEKMELEQLKEVSLMFNGNSPVIYRAEIADAVIYSLRSELKFLPVNEPVDKLCPDCDKSFKEGLEFDTHACIPEPSPTPAPTPTPAPVPVPEGSPGSKGCPVCTNWYAEGNDYLYHECVGYNVMCPLCGNWYEAGYDFLTHPCAYITPAPTASPTPLSRPNSNKTTNTGSANSGSGSIQCPVCTNWYAEGDSYLHHECVGYSVKCPICGNWYEAGYEMLTHPCATGELAPPVVRDRWQCQICGNWYDPGYNHSHSPLPGSSDAPLILPNGYQRCPKCMLFYSTGHSFDNHLCTGKPSDICRHCGQQFGTIVALETHQCPAGTPDKLCPQCGEWVPGGDAYTQHVQAYHTPLPTCHDCGAILDDASGGYLAHVLECPNNVNALICVCGVRFTDRGEYEAHLPYCNKTQCPSCGNWVENYLFTAHAQSCASVQTPAPTPAPTSEPAPPEEQIPEATSAPVSPSEQTLEPTDEPISITQ